MKKCKTMINTKGIISSFKELETYSYPFYLLSCVINGSLNIINIDNNYFTLKTDKYENNQKILKKANKIKKLKINDETFFFKKLTQNNLFFMYLRFKYLNSNEKYKFKLMSNFNYIQYLEQKLIGYKPSIIKGYYINRYILSWLPKKIKEKVKNINKMNLNFEDKYKLMYNMIKEYDNFKDFNQKYKKMIEESKKYKKKIENSNDYKKFIKKI